MFPCAIQWCPLTNVFLLQTLLVCACSHLTNWEVALLFLKRKKDICDWASRKNKHGAHLPLQLIQVQVVHLTNNIQSRISLWTTQAHTFYLCKYFKRNQMNKLKNVLVLSTTLRIPSTASRTWSPSPGFYARRGRIARPRCRRRALRRPGPCSMRVDVRNLDTTSASVPIDPKICTARITGPEGQSPYYNLTFSISTGVSKDLVDSVYF